MTLKKKLINESGYLLIESVVALSVLATLILVLFPLVVDWLVLVENEKEQVELSRALYESSVAWPETSTNKGYTANKTNRSLTLFDKNRTVDVHIYEVDFKE